MPTTDTTAVTDPEALRDHQDVPFHEESDVVDTETVEAVAEADDMAPVGVTNAAGEVLVMRVTDTCSWKIPTTAVGPDEDFDAAAREWVRRNTGLDIDLDGPLAVWRLRLRAEEVSAGGQAASRYFVVYGVDLNDVPELPTADAPDPAAETRWVTDLPEGASEVPGTDLFL
jgi:ADP-ribose pyrophosphatase YjhB (NUDIX family)